MRISDWSSDVCSSDLHTVESVETVFVRFYAGSGAVTLSAFDIARRFLARYAPRSAPLFEAEREAGRSAIHLRQHAPHRSEEHTSELQSLMRISYAVFCLKKKNNNKTSNT